MCARRLARSASSERWLVRVLAGLGSGSAARVRIWERRSWWRYRNERSTPGAGDRGDGYLVAVGAESVECIDDFAAAAAVVAPRGDQRVRGLCCHGWSFKVGSSAGDGVVGRPRCTPWRVRRTIATASSICRRSLAESQMPQILIDIADDRHRPQCPVTESTCWATCTSPRTFVMCTIVEWRQMRRCTTRGGCREKRRSRDDTNVENRHAEFRLHLPRARSPPSAPTAAAGGGFSRLGPRVGDVLLSGSSSALSVRYSARHG